MSPEPLPLKQLQENLEATQRVYEALLAVAERKQQCLTRHEIAALREALRDEERLAADGARLNAEREALHRACRAMFRIGPDAATLEALCERLPPEWRRRLGARRSELRSTLERLRAVNRINMALVNNSLDLMQGLLAALFDVHPTAAYGPRGTRPAPANALRALDAQA